jgi:hypothetical protein
MKTKKKILSLRTANFNELCTLAKDHYDIGDWTIATDGEGTVWISQQAMGCERTDHIEIPRKIFNCLVDAYQKPRNPVRK